MSTRCAVGFAMGRGTIRTGPARGNGRCAICSPAEAWYEAAPMTRARRLSHTDSRGRARMVDVSDKAETLREAVARGEVRMQAATLRLIASGSLPKGDVLAVARLAGIMAAK